MSMKPNQHGHCPKIMQLILLELLKDFLEKVISTFTTTTKYLQKKLLICSSALQSLSSLDPTVKGHSLTGNCLKKLATMMKDLIPSESDVHI